MNLLNLNYHICELIIIFLNLLSIVFFIWNLNLKVYPPLNLKEIINNVIKSKAEALNSVGLPDPEEEKKRKERLALLKKIVIGTVVVIGVIVAGYFGIKYYGGWD